ncbi:hypothetical protein KFL_000440390 [Klebsormidium nitens]|uniref:Uncharacterized protein n=1 Tax=Klebsormidium nitens TaxID=105231 RepID=A0A1Y1HW17_KLENI|nr:hypothetical protein KFL_000440390 [Klebsormidium nitens]|eukprot:GAQ80038.1 hypothetical protein KFL_000440390 [Klebsormidium nitens]
MAEALSKLAKAKSVAEKDGPSNLTPAETKPRTDIRLEGNTANSSESEVAIGRKDAVADGDLVQKGHEVITKSVDSSQEMEPKPGSVQRNTLEPFLAEVRPEAEQVSCSDVGEGLQGEDGKDSMLAVDPTASEDSETAEELAPAEDSSGAAGKDSLGGLAQELLLAEGNGAMAAVGSHRGLVKKMHIGQKGREERLKRAADKGTVERSMLLAERRGGGFIQSLPQPTSAGATSEAPAELAESHAGAHLDKQLAQGDVAITLEENAEQIGETMVPERLPAAKVVEGEESVQEEGLEESGEKVGIGEEAPRAGAGSELVAHDELEAEKENEAPARVNETPESRPEKPVKPCPEKEDLKKQPENGVADGSLMPLSVTLEGSLLAEEDSTCGGQPAHKRCYKSRPFSVPGVEKRVLAAAKKGAGQRDAILAERRMLS